MELYLMQHGLARPQAEDPEEGLSEAGRAQIEASGRALKRLGLELDLILASPKKRSRQSAEIVARALGLGPEGIVQTEAVRAKAPAEETLVFLQGLAGRRAVLIAGHLPSLGLTAAFLLTRGAPLPVAVENGAVMRLDLERLEPGAAVLQWYLRRDQLGLLAGGGPA